MNKVEPITTTRAQKAAIRGRLLMTVGTILLVYMVVSTGQALWQNYRLNQELAKLRDKNGELKIHNQYLQDLIAYRKTDSFKDKEARSKLNYQKVGETVLIIPDDGAQRFSEGNAKNSARADKERKLTNPEKWWRAFFSTRADNGGQA